MNHVNESLYNVTHHGVRSGGSSDPTLLWGGPLSHHVLQDTTRHVLQDTTRHVLQDTTRHVLQDTTRHILQDTTRHVLQDTTRHVLQDTTRHVLQYTTRHVLQDTTRHVLQDTTRHVLQDTTRHVLQDTTRHVLQDTTRHFLQDTTRHVLQDTTRHVLQDTTRHVLQDTTRLAGTAQTTAGTILMKNSLVIFNVVRLSGIEEALNGVGNHTACCLQRPSSIGPTFSRQTQIEIQRPSQERPQRLWHGSSMDPCYRGQRHLGNCCDGDSNSNWPLLNTIYFLPNNQLS